MLIAESARGKLLRMRRGALALIFFIASVLAACAPRTVTLPVVTTPRFPNFIRPAVPPSMASSQPAVGSDRSWTFLQAGDLDNAEREVDAVLTETPGFYPASATAGYVALARRRGDRALTHFDRALRDAPAYISALVGRGEALVLLERDREAVAAFELALAVEPSLDGLRRRVDVMRFREFERDIASAREAAGRGRTDAAIAAYQSAIARSPESAFLYRELAAIERKSGAFTEAYAHFREAVRLDPSDTGSMLAIAEILESAGALTEAISAYDAVLLLESSESVQGRRDRLRARLELERMPAQYQAIPSLPVASRADLAALIGVRLGSLLQGRTGEPVVLTDVRGHWAESWMLAVAGAGVIEAYANHTFQPASQITRVDLAQAIAAVLPNVARPQELSAWRSAPRRFTDLSTAHLAYPAASLAVASNVMTPLENETFAPSRVVTGAEATAAIERLRRMAESSGQLVSARP